VRREEVSQECTEEIATCGLSQAKTSRRVDAPRWLLIKREHLTKCATHVAEAHGPSKSSVQFKIPCAARFEAPSRSACPILGPQAYHQQAVRGGSQSLLIVWLPRHGPWN